MKLSIYCAHQISGLTWDDVINYYKATKTKLENLGYEVLIPMTGKSVIRTEVKDKFKPNDYTSPLATNHAIFERDKWMVTKADILYLNVLGCTTISIGSMMELAWASLLGKYTIVVMEKGSVYEHAFVAEAADTIFNTEEEAVEYFEKLINQSV
ncbi:nucleoside 2-deoxyribosyltransferase [Candidatus Dojkabacteria bacterium]|jgi:nucleoside 2-deoxyribosyltransferase|nr:nucleoside 2-deoxyribosyltransferase [Candidatus Dojkabacteria bacterium]